MSFQLGVDINGFNKFGKFFRIRGQRRWVLGKRISFKAADLPVATKKQKQKKTQLAGPSAIECDPQKKKRKKYFSGSIFKNLFFDRVESVDNQLFNYRSSPIFFFFFF